MTYQQEHQRSKSVQNEETMVNTQPHSPALEFAALQDIEGQVVLPGHADYDSLRMAFYGGIDRHPAVIVRVANTADVVRVVSLAREKGLELAIRSGGHSLAGHSVSDGGIVLDLRDMRGLVIDADNRTAWAESGVTAGEYTAAAAQYGLATGFGDTGSVGIGGITLGGGVGFLSRKYGLTIDDLLAAEIVTADGHILQVDAETHADLFWALRGGGGNFGVVTRFKFRLHPVDAIVGGMLILPASASVIARFAAAAEAAPEELSIIAMVMPAPPMPFVPEAYYGQLVVFGLFVYAGDVESGQQAVAPFRALAEPITDMIKPMRYLEMYHPVEEDYHPTAAAHTMFVDHIDLSVAETIMEHLRASDAPMSAAQFRVLGGAIARVPVDATAYAHRQAKIMVNVAAFYESLEEKARREAWVKEFAAGLYQGNSGAYVNFLGNDGAARIQDAYPPQTLERLRAVKARYDPGNLFHLNQNIQPASETVT
jgi:FAD/FMN-containing dehydrogenase